MYVLSFLIFKVSTHSLQDYPHPFGGPMQTHLSDLESAKKHRIDAGRKTRSKLRDATVKVHNILKRHGRDKAGRADAMLSIVELVEYVLIIFHPIRIIH